jgi:hypothetical protein
MSEASPRRLPIEIVVKRSFLYAWESRRILKPPFIVYAAVAILAEFLSDLAAGDKDTGTVYLLSAAEQIFAVAFSVGIHRYVLLNEARPGFQFFRWDRHFVRYLLLTIMLLLLAMTAALLVVGMVGTDAAEAAAGPGLTGSAVSLAIMAGVALVLARLALVLPSAALGDGSRPRDIWAAATGNSFRLLAATLLTALPFLIAEAALGQIAPSPRGGAGEFAVVVAQGLLSTAQLVVVTMMLSLSYDLLVRGGGPPAR